MQEADAAVQSPDREDTPTLFTVEPEEPVDEDKPLTDEEVHDRITAALGSYADCVNLVVKDGIVQASCECPNYQVRVEIQNALSDNLSGRELDASGITTKVST